MWIIRLTFIFLFSATVFTGSLLSPPAVTPAFAGTPVDVIHEVMPGDDLRLIAGYYYGDTRQWERIWEANRDQIKNPNRIEKGSLLRIPDVTAPIESYADFVVRVRGPRVPVAAAPTLAAPMPSIPQGEPLPPPSEPVTLRFKPAKGLVQFARMARTLKSFAQASGGRPVAVQMDARLRLRLAVEDIGKDGMVRVAVSVIEAGPKGTYIDFEDAGLPELDETLRLTANPLNAVVKVEGKQTETPYYFAIPFHLFYPETPTSIGGSWQFEKLGVAQANEKYLVATVRCTLVRREHFRSEEAYRIQCQYTAPVPSGQRLEGGETGEITVVMRARDGILLYSGTSTQAQLRESSGRFEMRASVRAIYEAESPPPAKAASEKAAAAPPAKRGGPAKRP